MNTTVQALQNLYVTLGGSLTDTYDGIADGAEVGNYVTIPDVIDAITAMNGGGGGAFGPLYVTFTESGGTYSSDKTLAEINTAWGTNKNIFGYNAATGYVLPLVYCSAEAAIFSCVALTAASTYTAMSMQVTGSGLVYEQKNVALANS